jgi:ElaB/YqjD/DUF883 family membrane-anchored ribosome-binding protein
MAMEERIDSAARDTIDRTQDALSSAGKSLKSGYDAAQKYAQNSDLGSQLGDFVVREPWMAVAAAFAIGYVAAHFMKRIS